MDGFELNKVAGAVLFALLVLFGARPLSDIIFAAHKPEKPGYEVAIPEPAETSTKDNGAAEKPLPVLLASGSAEKGERSAKKCANCHTFDSGGANKIGPNLHAVVGQAKANNQGFAYSDALRSKGGTWGYEELDAFLASPKGFLPGTKMAFAGVKGGQERANLILYLRGLGGNPPPLPEPEAAPAEKPADAPAEKSVEKPTKTPAAPPADKPASAPSEKPADAPADKPADTPAEKPADAPAEKPVEKPTETPAAPPADKPASAPSEKPADAPADKPADTPAEKPAETPTDKPAQ